MRWREFARSGAIERQTRNWLCHHCDGLWAECILRARAVCVYEYCFSSVLFIYFIFFSHFIKPLDTLALPVRGAVTIDRPRSIISPRIYIYIRVRLVFRDSDKRISCSEVFVLVLYTYINVTLDYILVPIACNVNMITVIEGFSFTYVCVLVLLVYKNHYYYYYYSKAKAFFQRYLLFENILYSQVLTVLS